VRARGSDEAELLSLAATVPFDDRVDDLDRGLIVDFLDEIGSELVEEAGALPMVELARQMQLVDGPDEAVFPRNVGLMFFHEEPWRFFPGMQIDVVWFPEGPGGRPRPRKERTMAAEPSIPVLLGLLRDGRALVPASWALGGPERGGAVVARGSDQRGRRHPRAGPPGRGAS